MTAWGSHNVPAELQADLAQMFPGLSVEEALEYQESLHQSLKTSGVRSIASSSHDEPSSSQGYSLGEYGGGDYDLALDEALARSLQELDFADYDLEQASHSEIVQVTPGDTRHVAGGSSNTAAVQDDINPDEMTYEELQDLGDSVGSESKGLSESEISSLPTRIYKVGFFSKKVDIGECAICYSGYKNKQSVTTLPCAHQYHTECINRWLDQNKTCPVCKKEAVPS